MISSSCKTCQQACMVWDDRTKKAVCYYCDWNKHIYLQRGFMSSCKHPYIFKAVGENDFKCANCGVTVGNDRCKVCGSIMRELILLTSKTKYCKNCESKKGAQTVPQSSTEPNWLDELTETDLDELFRKIT